MFTKFDEASQQILQLAKREMINLKSAYISSEHLLLAILKSDNRVSKKLNDIGVNYDIFKNKIIEVLGKGYKKSEWFLYTPLLKRIIERASANGRQQNDGLVTVEYLFSSLVEEGEGVAIRILISLNTDLDKLEKIAKELKMANKFNKADLKERWLIKTKKAGEFIVTKVDDKTIKCIDLKANKFVREDRSLNEFDLELSDDLTYKYNHSYDIVEVFKPHYDKVWEREEEPTPKKMTVAEIQKELGYKVEIVE